MTSAGQGDGESTLVRVVLWLAVAALISVVLGFAVGLARPRVKSLSA